LTQPDGADSALRHALARVPEFGGRVLRVVYDPREKPVRVITAYFDRAMKDRL